MPVLLPPAPPTGIESLATDTSVTLSWTAPTGETVTGYQVLRRTGATGDGADDFTVLVDDTGSDATTYTDTTVASSTAYVYRIKSRNDNGLGPASADVDVTTEAPLIVLPGSHFGVGVTPTELIVEEGGANAYDVVLDSQPTADVTVTVTVPTGSNLTVDEDTLTFTDVNWNVAQTVTVTAAADGNTVTDMATITHAATSTDTDYGSGITIHSVSVTIYDSSFRVRIKRGDEELELTEGDSIGEQLCFSLSDLPTEDVTVTLTAEDGSELHIYPTEFTVTDTGEHCSTVTAGPDVDGDDDEVTITLEASGDSYDASPTEQVQVGVDDLGGSPSPGVWVGGMIIAPDIRINEFGDEVNRGLKPTPVHRGGRLPQLRGGADLSADRGCVDEGHGHEHQPDHNVNPPGRHNIRNSQADGCFKEPDLHGHQLA